MMLPVEALQQFNGAEVREKRRRFVLREVIIEDLPDNQAISCDCPEPARGFDKGEHVFLCLAQLALLSFDLNGPEAACDGENRCDIWPARRLDQLPFAFICFDRPSICDGIDDVSRVKVTRD